MENGKQTNSPTAGAPIRDFKDLETWKVARTLRQSVFEVTKGFPVHEQFGLVSQMRRAASSVTANIAEGYGRFSYQENVQFSRHARASVFELRDHFTTALDAEYISKEKYNELEALAMSVIRLLNGYIRSTLKRKNGPA